MTKGVINVIRGTTPTHIFNLPIDTVLVDKIRIIYAQKDEILLTKEKADCKMEGNTVTVKLTQEETLQFNHNDSCQIQIRVLTTGGDSLASGIRRIEVDKLLEEGVI